MRPGAGSATADLLEREDEFERLTAHIDAALAGDGSVVALEGEAGIGKSVLLTGASEHAAEAGMRVLSARGGELERDFGYGLVRQLFDAPLARMDCEERERVLSGAAGLAAPALSLPGIGAGRPGDAGSVLHGLYWLTANLAAERPLLLAIDDTHWTDGASIAFLSYLARRVEGLALVIVYATRVGEGSSDALPATADPGTVQTALRLAELSERATDELIGRFLGSESSPQFGHACHVATGGNPFLLQELLRALQADHIAPDERSCARVAQIAPETVSRAILARLRRLGDSASRLAFATAVLGKSAELRHAAALAQLDHAAAGAAADALTAAAILGDGRPLQFIHPIVRTTVYGEIPRAQRAASHKRAALLLGEDSVAAAELAPHLLACEPAGDPEVVRCLRAAADEVGDRGAPEASCAYLLRALAEPPAPEDRSNVVYELGSAALMVGRPEAVGWLREAMEGAVDAQLYAKAALNFVVAHAIRGHVVEGLDLLASAVAKVTDEGDAEGALRLEGLYLCTAQLDPTTTKPVRERLARYDGQLTGSTPGERLLLASIAFDAAHRPQPATRAAHLAELALSDGAGMLAQHQHSANFPFAVWALFYADELARAEQLYTLQVEYSRETGSLLGLAIGSGCRCHVRLRMGRIADAEAEARSTLEATAQAWPMGRPMLIACVLDAMSERADPAECHAFLDEHGIAEDMAAESMANRLLYSRGHLRLAVGDPQGALRDFEQIRGREQQAGMETAAMPTRASAALAHGQLGEHERATALASEELELARVWGTPSALSFALRTAGIVTGGDAGLELLREAAAVVDTSPARYERARSLTEYGAALRRAGHRREAREPLREALELADRCGALRTARRAREELLATGARPRRAARSGADSLTPSERRVCRLATEGLSNREIAQALFVTVRTVEGHLTQAYMKLDIASREQLAAALQPPAD